MIYWDLDGVLRDISKGAYGYHIPEWNYRGEDGRNLIQRVNDNISILVKSPPTEYKDLVERAYEVLDEPLTILTVQPRRWQSFTRLWILNHFKKVECKIVMFQSPRDKFQFFLEQEPSLLVEDHPCLPSYDRVVLVRRPWNTSVNGSHKVINNIEDMHAFILSEVI